MAHVVAATGTGPVDAAYQAIDKVVAVHGDLAEFSVKAITRGIDALGEVTVRITADDGKVYTGRGADNDIIVSSRQGLRQRASTASSQTTRSKEREVAARNASRCCSRIELPPAGGCPRAQFFA